MADQQLGSDVEMMSEEELPSYARWLVYGLGRASGISVTPRSCSGTVREQLAGLIAAVEEATKVPTDDELSLSSRASAETDLSEADARSLVRILQRYVSARLAAQRGTTEE